MRPCKFCGWALDDLEVCTNPKCPSVLANESQADDTSMGPQPNVGPPLPNTNRRERRGNPTGRYAKRAPGPQPPDKKAAEERERAIKREVESRRRSKTRKRKADQRVARRQGR